MLLCIRACLQSHWELGFWSASSTAVVVQNASLDLAGSWLAVSGSSITVHDCSTALKRDLMTGQLSTQSIATGPDSQVFLLRPPCVALTMLDASLGDVLIS